MSQHRSVAIQVNGALLKGVQYEPQGRSSGTVHLFAPPPGRYGNYTEVLERLGDIADTFCFNARGQGTSEGVFDHRKCIDDYVLIQEQFTRGKSLLIGHCLSVPLALATVQKTQPAAVVGFCPYPGMNALPRSRRLLLRGVKAYVDHTQESSKKSKIPFSGFTNQGVRAAIDAWHDVDPVTYRIEQPFLYFVSDIDGAAGTTNPVVYEHHRTLLRSVSSRAEDGSDVVKGLNHALNTRCFDWRTFFKHEDGKERELVFDRLLTFVEQHIG